MFKVSKSHWRRSGIFIVNFEHTLHSSVSIVSFDQVNAAWEANHCDLLYRHFAYTLDFTNKLFEKVGNCVNGLQY